MGATSDGSHLAVASASTLGSGCCSSKCSTTISFSTYEEVQRWSRKSLRGRRDGYGGGQRGVRGRNEWRAQGAIWWRDEPIDDEDYSVEAEDNEDNFLLHTAQCSKWWWRRVNGSRSAKLLPTSLSLTSWSASASAGLVAHFFYLALDVLDQRCCDVIRCDIRDTNTLNQL